MIEPIPPDPNFPRYSARPLPPYRFVRGRTPHPRRDPNGHAFGKPEPRPPAFPPGQWRNSDWYLYGIDLYNFAYWWESHEVFEGLWHAVGHHTEQGQFFQAIIQIAAANLKRFLGVAQAADNLKQRGLDRLQRIPQHYMGVDVVSLSEDIRAYFTGTRHKPALISLAGFNQTGNLTGIDKHWSFERPT